MIYIFLASKMLYNFFFFLFLKFEENKIVEQPINTFNKWLNIYKMSGKVFK